MERIVNPKNPNEIYEYHLDSKLKKYLDERVKKDLHQQDKDYVMLIDGYEGSGKSTFAFQVARYIDPSFDLSRVCMTSQEFIDAIINSEKNQAIVYDEAITGVSSGDATGKIGKLLKSMMMQMRQKNLFVIIIMPIIFEFSRYAVLSRARAFFHVYESKGNRGYWVGFNQKDLRQLYLLGKVNYKYLVRSFFNGRFYGKWAIPKDEYLQKKASALFELDDDSKKDTKKERNILIKIIYKYLGTIDRVKEELEANGLEISRSTLGYALKGAKNP